MRKRIPSKEEPQTSLLREMFTSMLEEYEALNEDERHTIADEVFLPASATMWHARTVIAMTKATRQLGQIKSWDNVVAIYNEFHLKFKRAREESHRLS
jgi:hypothetical protein